MNKKILSKNGIIITVFSLCIFISACKKETVSNPNPVNMYGPGLNEYGVAFASTVYNGNLIVAGKFDSAGGIRVNNIAQWNGTSWSALGSGISNKVYALAVYNGNLIAAGYFDSAGGIPMNSIAQWNGVSWSSLAVGLKGWFQSSIACQCMTIYNGNLVVGGYFCFAGGDSVNNIASWNGTSWTPFGKGLNSSDLAVQTLGVYNGNLVAAGGFNTFGGVSVNNIAQWNGTSWSALGSGVSPGSTVYALAVFNGNLIVTGNFNTAGGIAVWGIASWNGSAWSALGNQDAGGYSLCLYNGTLVAGGGWGVYGWNGSNWSSSVFAAFQVWQDHTNYQGPSLNYTPYVGVYTMTLYNGNLITGGGSFNEIEGAKSAPVYAQGVAQWNGSSWSAL